MQVLLLPVGPEWYAVDTCSAREVVADPLVVPLPTAPTSVLGMFNLRGEIVPVFDAGSLLGVGRSSEHSFAVVVDTALGPAALAVHGVPEVAVLGEQTGTAEVLGALSTHAAGERLVVLLDLEALLAPARIGDGR